MQARDGSERPSRLWALLGLVFFLSCVSEAPRYDLPKVQGGSFAEVEVFFATDRELRVGSSKPEELFGEERSELSFGVCRVSIPVEHELGRLEEPSLWRLEFREDPDRHVVVLSATPRPEHSFFADLERRIERSPEKSAFLFVHGYNASFSDAARRTAQMAYDLAFAGAPVFYSWPSKGSIAAYAADEASVAWAQEHLERFLGDVLRQESMERVYVIAHSMGSRALTGALLAVKEREPLLMDKVQEVILAAPDIDAAIFRRDIAPGLLASHPPVTLYASSDDLALEASKKVHGAPRLGDSGHELVVLEGLETIDATGADTSLVGHSYYAEARSILSDLYYLVHEGQRADERFGLERVRTKDGVHWRFRP